MEALDVCLIGSLLVWPRCLLNRRDERFLIKSVPVIYRGAYDMNAARGGRGYHNNLIHAQQQPSRARDNLHICRQARRIVCTPILARTL